MSRFMRRSDREWPPDRALRRLEEAVKIRQQLVTESEPSARLALLERLEAMKALTDAELEELRKIG